MSCFINPLTSNYEKTNIIIYIKVEIHCLAEAGGRAAEVYRKRDWEYRSMLEHALES